MNREHPALAYVQATPFGNTTSIPTIQYIEVTHTKTTHPSNMASQSKANARLHTEEYWADQIRDWTTGVEGAPAVKVIRDRLKEMQDQLKEHKTAIQFMTMPLPDFLKVDWAQNIRDWNKSGAETQADIDIMRAGIPVLQREIASRETQIKNMKAKVKLEGRKGGGRP